MSFLSTSDLFLRHDRISFGKGATGTSPDIEQLVITPDTTGTKLFFGPSSFISTATSGNLQQLFPSIAAFTFDISNQRLGVGTSKPTYAIDISSNTGIRVSGGSFTGSGYGLISVNTTALISTLPTSIFAPSTIPASALIFGPQFLPQASVYLSSIADLSALPNRLAPNSFPLSLLASSGNITLTSPTSVINAVTISAQQLFVSSIVYPANTTYDSLAVGTLTGNAINTIGISSGLFTGNFFGSGFGITNLNPANLASDIPSDKFATHSIALAALQQYGNLELNDGNITVNTGTVTSQYFSGSNITISSVTLFDPGKNQNNYLNASAGTLLFDGEPLVGGGGGLNTTQVNNLIQSYIQTNGIGSGSGSAISTFSTAYVSSLQFYGGTSTALVNQSAGILFLNGAPILTGNSNGIDPWIQKNLIDPPLAINFGTPQSKSTQIFIPWTYPIQSNVGFQYPWVPVITSLTTIVSTSLATTTLINHLSSGGYINSNDGSPYITGVVLTNVAGSSGIQSFTFPQDGLVRSAYNYANVSLVGPGQLIAYYANNNRSTNIASTIFTNYSAGGVPSQPTHLQRDGITSNTANIYFSTPQSVDITDPSSSAIIQAYDLSFNSVPIPGIRYGTSVSDAQTAVVNTPFTFVTGPDANPAKVIQYAASSLYPDSTYTFYVDAQNSFSLRGAYASTVGISTLNLLANSGITVNFPTRYYSGTIKRVSDSLTVTTLVNTSTDWVASNFTAPIHATASRGKQGIGTLALSAALTSPTSVQGPTVYYNGFPATTPIAATQSNLTVTPTNVYDKYASPVQYTGYYLNSSNTMTIKSATFAANSTIYSFVATSYQSTATDTLTNTSQTNFYYDGAPGSATVNSLSFNFATSPVPTATLVSGVYVISGTPTMSTITTTSNMGQFFYISPLINYSLSAGSITTTGTETALTNSISGVAAGRFTPSTAIVFSNAFVSNSLTTGFGTSLQMGVIANNVAGASAQTTASVAAIVDGPSVALLTTLPATLPTLVSGTAATGCRIWSGASYNSSNVIAYVYSTSTSYTTILYSHTNQLTDSGQTYATTTELQVTNGAHRTKGTNTTSYLNYTSYFYSATLQNTANYTSITTSGSRFATFAWKITQQGTNYSALTLVINTTTGTDALSINNNQVIFTGGTPATDKLFVYYRIEDQASTLPTNATSATTVWLDANGSIASAATALNYYTDATGTMTQIRGGVGSGATLATGTVTFPALFIPSFATTAKDVRVFCRIGVPMNWNFAFTTVTARIS